MSKPRDTYKYQVKVGSTVVHMGFTTDLKRREIEHKIEFPFCKIVQKGHRTTLDAARNWEYKKLKKYSFEPKELRSISEKTRTKLLQYKDEIYKVLEIKASVGEYRVRASAQKAQKSHI